MAYKNIVWVKLERRLLNDYRWYQMSFHAQLLYIKLILFAAETYNKIPKVIPTLMSALRMELEVGQFKCALEEVKKNFPKFKSNKHFYYFDEFENKTNWLPAKQLPSKSPAIAKHSVEKKRKEKDKEKRKNPPKLSDFDFLKNLKTDPIYNHINIDFELLKMDKWLLANPGRQKTRRFIVNWLNKIEKPIGHQRPKEPKANPSCSTCKGTGKIQEGEHKGAQCYCVV